MLVIVYIQLSSCLWPRKGKTASVDRSDMKQDSMTLFAFSAFFHFPISFSSPCQRSLLISRLFCTENVVHSYCDWLINQPVLIDWFNLATTTVYVHHCRQSAGWHQEAAPPGEAAGCCQAGLSLIHNVVPHISSKESYQNTWRQKSITFNHHLGHWSPLY